VIDPWGGSAYVEGLTKELIDKATALIDEVEALGGMTKAIESGLPKMRIEEAAARRQARIDAGKDTIVGVNKYKNTSNENPLEVLSIDNNEVRDKQIAKLKSVKEGRDENAVKEALQFIENGTRDTSINLLKACVDAARERCTLGEISVALEKEFGRYKAQIRAISGIYSSEIKMNEDFIKAQAMSDAFAEKEGRRPRILVAKMGQDGHDRGAKVIATGFADIGFDVDIGPLFQTPAEVAKQAIENDVHILGISSLAGGHKSLIPEVITELKKWGREDVIIVAGGVIPQQDYDALYAAGVDFVFGPGTVMAQAAVKILEKMGE
jgi:methylmalonyl-CoA mutase